MKLALTLPRGIRPTLAVLMHTLPRPFPSVQSPHLSCLILTPSQNALAHSVLPHALLRLPGWDERAGHWVGGQAEAPLPLAGASTLAALAASLLVSKGGLLLDLFSPVPLSARPSSLNALPTTLQEAHIYLSSKAQLGIVIISFKIFLYP